MDDSRGLVLAPQSSPSLWQGTFSRVLGLTFFLYAFLVSIGMLGKSFKLFGGGFVGDLIQSASNPLIGLFQGILATALVQSSSTTTSLVVALVASGTMPIATAIPIIMGANVGTSVTNLLVSLGHITRENEFRRAFSAATVHDFFNVSAVLILFPLQVSTNLLGRAAHLLSNAFQEVGGLTFTSPLKMVTGPVVGLVAGTLKHHPWVLLVLSLVILFVSLRYLVVLLKGVVLTRVETFFDQTLFRSPARAMGFGLVLTALVQSSSVTTSLAVPLAGAGILKLRQIFPYTLGANVGTTVTAILAALAIGDAGAVTVAFAHLLFNVIGIAIIWPIRAIREIPPTMAEKFSEMAVHRRWIAVVFILACFYVIPLAAIMVLR